MNLISTLHDIGDNSKYAKRVIKNKKYDVIHMHLKLGESISTHHAPTEVIIIVRSGEVEFDIEGEIVTLTNEHVLHLEPYEKHSLKAIDETDLIVMKMY